MITLLLLLANTRLNLVAPALSVLVDAGNLKQAAAHGLDMLDRGRRDPAPQCDALVGRVTARALLALGREEEAEDLMRQMFKTYDALPRKSIRCHTAIDQATFMLHLNKPLRAAQMIVDTADDADAPAEVRIEVLVLLGSAYLSMGRHADAFQALELARELAAAGLQRSVIDVVELARLQLEVSVLLRSRDELSDHGHCAANDAVLLRLRSATELDGQLAELGRRLDPGSLAAHHAAELRARLGASLGWAGAAQAVLIEAARIDACKMSGIAAKFRLDGALACLAGRNAAAATELLAPLIYDEQKLARHRFAGELKYCASKLHAHNGRHCDALRFYKLYSCAALETLRMEAVAVRVPRCLAVRPTTCTVDATEGRLPARYRRAYRYLIENLDRAELSVRQIAAQIGVTERSLQLAFHKHLGMTPAEVIRGQRMQRIHADLSAASSQDSVLAVATRWGVTSRSTLAQRYRQSFSKTPSETLREAVYAPA